MKARKEDLDMLPLYVPHSSPNGLLKKNNRPLFDKILRVKEDLGILGAEDLLGISFPYTGQEFREALERVFPLRDLGGMSEDETALYYAVNDLLRDDGVPHGDVLFHTVEDEEWLRERYGDEYYEEHYGPASQDGTLLSLIRSLTARQHMTSSHHGYVYDTGIRGTLLSFTDEDVENFIEALAAYGPFAFILDEPHEGIYDVACTDSPYFIFNGIWDDPFSDNAYIRELQGVDESGMQVEYMVGSTISIMEAFGLDYQEVEEFLQGNPQDYDNGVDWYMVNHYRGRTPEYWPFR